MSYCKVGEIPKVKYSFSDSSEKIYLSNSSPIDVVLTPIYPSFTGGQCKGVLYYVYTQTRFTLSHFGTYVGERISEGINDGQFWGPIYGARFKYAKPLVAYELGQGNWQILCHGWTLANFGTPSGYQIEPIWATVGGTSGGIPLDYTSKVTKVERLDGKPDTCGNLKDRVRLEVKYNDLTIFADEGDSPCSFEVICGDCPEGYMRCESSGYPGYCCLPCDSIKSSIRSTTAMLRSKVNG